MWLGVDDWTLCTFDLAVDTAPSGSGIACGLMSTQLEMVDHLASKNNTTTVGLFGHYHPRKDARRQRYNEVTGNVSQKKKGMTYRNFFVQCSRA